MENDKDNMDNKNDSLIKLKMPHQFFECEEMQGNRGNSAIGQREFFSPTIFSHFDFGI